MMMLRRRMLRRKTDPKTGNHTFCEPAQSKCTWTCHKRQFVRNSVRACAVETHMDMSQEAFCAEIYIRKMPDASETTSIEHRALTVTVRTTQCGHTVWGIIHVYKTISVKDFPIFSCIFPCPICINILIYLHFGWGFLGFCQAAKIEQRL